ncbi:hypothetical protein OIY81_2681 [Cryptosporidium canis]|uniref:Uncharacterized protein n=1 Tax=Cryptosporidium canis TaxID=195482 RepID=A0ABQ8PBX8_9CRYT|nr:hypothetical protein OIY81_2681 [Cryptosporidium canis]KAJ1615383.1 hypothetical protein OJ252_177 [Cryptosporidium canis]
MDLFDDEALASRVSGDLKKKPNIFDDLVGEDDYEADEMDDFFFDGKARGEELLFRGNHGVGEVILEDALEKDQKERGDIWGSGEELEVENWRRASDHLNTEDKLDFKNHGVSLSGKDDNDFGDCASSEKAQGGETLFEHETNLVEADNLIKVDRKEENTLNDTIGWSSANRAGINELSPADKAAFDGEPDNEHTINDNVNDEKEFSEDNVDNSPFKDDRKHVEPSSEPSPQKQVGGRGPSSSTRTSPRSLAKGQDECLNLPKDNEQVNTRQAERASTLQSSIHDIDWSRVVQIIEGFEAQIGYTGQNPVLFKSILYSLKNISNSK